MRVVIGWTGLVLCATLALTAMVRADVVLVHEDPDFGRTLAEVDMSSRVLREIGELPSEFTDIAFGPSGTLYGVTRMSESDDGSLYSIDPSSGAAERIGSLLAHATVNALAIDNAGQIYGAAREDTFLYSIDAATGKATLVADIGVQSAGDMTFGADGLLYLTSIDDQLWSVDLAKDFRAQIGRPIGVDLGFSHVFGLATTSAGTTYGFAGNQAIEVDLATGAGTLLFQLGQDDGLGPIGGATARRGIVPEPTSSIAWLTVALGTLRWRWRHCESESRTQEAAVA